MSNSNPINLYGLDSRYALTSSGANTRYPIPTIDLLGDSITAINGTAGSPISLQSRGYMAWAIILLNQRVRFINSFGVGGQTTTSYLSRMAPVLSSSSNFVVVEGGVNDVAQAVSPATTQSNLTYIYSQLIGAGKTVIATTITTSTTISGGLVTASISAGTSTFQSNVLASSGDTILVDTGGTTESVTVQSCTGGSSPYTITITGTFTYSHGANAICRNSTKLAALHSNNQWIVQYARANAGILLCDWHSIYADPATGAPLGVGYSQPSLPNGITIDGTHPNKDGAALMGQQLANTLDKVLPLLPIRSGDNTDSSNLVTNGKTVGNTSGVAPGWTISSSDTVTLTYTASKVGRTDGIAGEWQQIKIGPGNLGGFQIYSDTSGLTFDGTTSYIAQIEFQGDLDIVAQASPTIAGASAINMTVITRTGSSTTGSTQTLFSASGIDGIGTYWPGAGIFRTLPFVPTNSTNRVQIFINVQGIDTGTFRFTNAELRKATI